MNNSVSLVKSNTKFLLSKLNYMETKVFVEKLQVAPSTVTRWKSGVTTPTPYMQKLICDYFGIDDFTILGKINLRTQNYPITLLRKRELIAQLAQMSDEKIEKIYPEVTNLILSLTAERNSHGKLQF